jgi:hypothetical protein
LDVYSNPVSPVTVAKDPDHPDRRFMNIDATEPSKAQRILEQAEAKRLKVQGWVRIPEIHDETIPSYVSSQE